MADHPTFASGHCFATETLSKPDVELVGALISREIRALEEKAERMAKSGLSRDYTARGTAKRYRQILDRLDYPQPIPAV